MNIFQYTGIRRFIRFGSYLLTPEASKKLAINNIDPVPAIAGSVKALFCVIYAILIATLIAKLV